MGSDVRPTAANNTFYLPLTPDMAGQEIEAVVLAFDPTKVDLSPEVWVTAYPAPFESRTLVLHE